MKAKRINDWLTLGANIGVLIGIILLLVELNQNSTMMRAQTRFEVSQGIVDLLNLSASNEQLASVLRRADSGEELILNSKGGLDVVLELVQGGRD